MLGTDKSRGYCLERICADFLAGAHLGRWQPSDPPQLDLTLLQVLIRRTAADFPRNLARRRPVDDSPKGAGLRLDSAAYEGLRQEVLNRDG